MSKLIVTCRCGSKFAANPARAGQVMPCPKCGADIEIPADEPELVAAARLLFPDADHQARDVKTVLAEMDSWMARMPDGQIFGPVEYAKLQRAAAMGRLPPGTMVRKSTHAKWQPVESVVEADANAMLDDDYRIAPD